MAHGRVHVVPPHTTEGDAAGTLTMQWYARCGSLYRSTTRRHHALAAPDSPYTALHALWKAANDVVDIGAIT